MDVSIEDWDGETITRPGLYRGIPLKDEYHGNINLLPGPSVSKSDLKHIAPPDGSPKKFWQFWKHNPNHIRIEPTKAMIFGRAVHALLLGDEAFDENFVIRPDRIEGEKYQGNKTVWRDWYAQQSEAGMEVLTKDDMAQIRLMFDDAQKHPFIQSGGLNGEIEISMFAKDPKTKIWLRSRPDVEVDDGDYADLKTAGSLEEGFLSRQLESAGYYLQGAMTRRVCQMLGKPFRSFSFVYVLSEDYADTDFRVLSDEDLALGDRVIDYGLTKIRAGINSGEWQGMSYYNRENFPIRMLKAKHDRISNLLSAEGF